MNFCTEFIKHKFFHIHKAQVLPYSQSTSSSTWVSLIWSGFPLTDFYLVEAPLSAFLWLYTLVCAFVQKYQEMPFIYNYSHF